MQPPSLAHRASTILRARWAPASWCSTPVQARTNPRRLSCSTYRCTLAFFMSARNVVAFVKQLRRTIHVTRCRPSSGSIVAARPVGLSHQDVDRPSTRAHRNRNPNRPAAKAGSEPHWVDRRQFPRRGGKQASRRQPLSSREQPQSWRSHRRRSATLCRRGASRTQQANGRASDRRPLPLRRPRSHEAAAAAPVGHSLGAAVDERLGPCRSHGSWFVEGAVSDWLRRSLRLAESSRAGRLFWTYWLGFEVASSLRSRSQRRARRSITVWTTARRPTRSRLVCFGG